MLEIFVPQYMSILLLGMQSLLVHRDEKVLAAINAMFIATFNFQILNSIARDFSTLASPEGLAYISASALGILSAMYAHAFLQTKLQQWRKHKARRQQSKEQLDGQ